MKKSLIVVAAAILAVGVGCDQQRQASNDRSLNAEKDSVQKSVKEAKSEVDKQAKAQKDILEAESKAAQAKIDAEKARAKAESTDAQGKVDAAAQNIREAAGSASAKAQSEIGANKSTVTVPPAEPSTTPATPVPTAPTPTPPAATAEADQKLTEQVRAAVVGGGDANTGAAIQISTTGGTVTLKGNVKSEAEKAQAEQKAKAVSGVTQVDNQLQVKE